MSRTEFGFERTVCACRRCTICCEHMPGPLAPSDLQRMAEHLGYADVQAFARENLLASDGANVTTDKGKVICLPVLIPATQANGHCKFLHEGRCTIHSVSPFNCAFIDPHQSDEEYRRRIDPFYRALHEHWRSHGLYASVWEDLNARGLTALPLETKRYRLKKALRRENLR